MRLTVSAGPSKWRRALPWFGIGAGFVAALTLFVASLSTPDTAAWWVTALAIGGLAAGFTLEYLAGRALEAWQRRQQLARVVKNLRARTPRGPATLLSPHRATEIGVQLLGRDAELAELLRWCTESGTPFHLITGPGGVGKTRLADELQHRLRDLDHGWECLFLSTGAEAHSGALAAVRERAGDHPVLVVVDYAENRRDLREFLADALEDPGTLRVLMLARQAGNWWEKLTAIPGGLGDALANGYRDSDLPDIEAAPQDIVNNAAAAFAAHLGVPVPQLRVEGTDRLRVLDLTATALVAVLDILQDAGHRAAPIQVDATQVFAELLRHEADRYWQATAREVGLEDTLTVGMQRVLVATIALLGSVDEPSIVALVDRVLETFPEEAPPTTAAGMRWLGKTYPTTDDATHSIEPLTPDRVAEHLVVEVLTISPRPVTRRVTALLENLSEGQAVRAMTVLSRAATDPARNHDQRERIRMLADHLANHLRPNHLAVGRVLDAIPWRSVTMAPTAMRLARIRLDLLDDAPDADVAQVADAARELGLWLSELGRPDEALPFARRAVELYQRIAHISPDRYEPDLATSLDNLGFRLSVLGLPDQALPVNQRAVKLYQRLAQTNPGRHEPDLAKSLTSLGAGFADLGRPEEALLPAQQAVALFERLAQTDPERHEPELSRALHHLGARLSELGQPDAALPASQRAVEIRERLVRDNPDRYEPALARALRNLGAQLSELGELEEALAVTQRAVDLFQRLAGTNPDRYNSGLAHALNDLGARYSSLRRLGEAIPPTQLAVEIRERLARTNPDRYEADLARVLNDLGSRFSALGRPDEALTAVEHAVDLYERVARRHPTRFQTEYQRVKALLDGLRRDYEQGHC